jgi:cytochrome c
VGLLDVKVMLARARTLRARTRTTGSHRLAPVRRARPCCWRLDSTNKGFVMNTTLIRTGIGAAALMLGSLLMPVTAYAAVDADAAQALAKKNDCMKCHAIDKDKKGPSYKKIAAKYKGKADGQDKAIKNMTTVSKVKLDDGTEEDHKIIKLDPAKPADLAAIKNLADWILSQ